jgi:hypothetical protein
VSRERVAGLALLTYPPVARAARGDEMLATLLDASAGSRRRFARELADLVRVGLQARGAETASAGVRRVIADGLCLAGAWFMTLDVSTLLAQRVRGMHDPLLSSGSIALIAAVLVIALIGYDRLAGAGALLWTALRFPALIHDNPGIAGLAPEVLPVICFVVMLLVPRRRAPDLRRLAWLLVPATLVAALGPPPVDQSPLLLAYVALAAVLVVLFALASLPTDPRLAIAGAVPTTCLGVGVVGHAPDDLVLLMFLAAAPLVLAVAVTRTRRLRQRSLSRT